MRPYTVYLTSLIAGTWKRFFLAVFFAMLTSCVSPGNIETVSEADLRSAAQQIVGRLPSGTRVAVDDFELDGGRRINLGRYLSGIVLDEIGTNGVILPVERARLEAALSESEYSLNQLYQDPTRFKQAGAFLPAEFLIAGTISILNDRLAVRLRIFSVSTGEIVSTASARVPRNSDIEPMIPLVY